jgi:hypothetical protein
MNFILFAPEEMDKKWSVLYSKTATLCHKLNKTLFFNKNGNFSAKIVYPNIDDRFFVHNRPAFQFAVC